MAVNHVVCAVMDLGAVLARCLAALLFGGRSGDPAAFDL